jgi:hypothetical protein
MRGLLVRVGADQTKDGGKWNGPVNLTTGKFVYVPIPEVRQTRPDMARPYEDKLLVSALSCLGKKLPEKLRKRCMHLDPDFEHLTYGDQGDKNKRGNQIEKKLKHGDILAFYAGLRDIRLPKKPKNLVYAIIGIYVIQRKIVKAKDVPAGRRHENAHTRVLLPRKNDIVVRAQPSKSGRLERCIHIGGWRRGAYRVFPNMLRAWGDLDVEDGWIQRSARLPEFCDADKFYAWFKRQRIFLKARNN